MSRSALLHAFLGSPRAGLRTCPALLGVSVSASAGHGLQLQSRWRIPTAAVKAAHKQRRLQDPDSRITSDVSATVDGFAGEHTKATAVLEQERPAFPLRRGCLACAQCTHSVILLSFLSRSSAFCCVSCHLPSDDEIDPRPFHRCRMLLEQPLRPHVRPALHPRALVPLRLAHRNRVKATAIALRLRLLRPPAATFRPASLLCRAAAGRRPPPPHRTATCWLTAAVGVIHRDCSCKPRLTAGRTSPRRPVEVVCATKEMGTQVD